MQIITIIGLALLAIPCLLALAFIGGVIIMGIVIPLELIVALIQLKLDERAKNEAIRRNN